MEDTLIQWVHRHVDIIKYAGIALGLVYSCYRRLVTDGHTERREEQKDIFLQTVTEHLAEAQKREDRARDEMTRCAADHQRLLLENDALKKTTSDLHATIRRLESRLTELGHPPHTNDLSSSSDDCEER